MWRNAAIAIMAVVMVVTAVIPASAWWPISFFSSQQQSTNAFQSQNQWGPGAQEQVVKGSNEQHQAPGSSQYERFRMVNRQWSSSPGSSQYQTSGQFQFQTQQVQGFFPF